jgi:hypothetical protein
VRLVLDEDVNWRIAPELTARGYDATSCEQMGIARRRVKDPVLLYILTRQATTCTLVTFDNRMPTRHPGDILKRNGTLAVVDSKADRRGLTREQYTREVVHRWAHRMAAQSPGTRYKYRLTGRTLITI